MSAVELVTEEIADNLEEAAAATRQIDPRAVGFFFVGVGVGFALGFWYGYRYSKEKLRSELLAESEETIAEIRNYYQSKIIAQANTDKPAVEKIIAERGYYVPMEMSNSGENPIGPFHPDPQIEDERPLKAPVPVAPARKMFRTAESEKDKFSGWNFPSEMAKRSPDHPYIIHQDEYSENESEYSQQSLTYYHGDDMLVDEHNMVVPNRDQLIGLSSITRFGHGTDDWNLLYVRNDELEIEFELIRVPFSYEESVQGLNDDDPTETTPS